MVAALHGGAEQVGVAAVGELEFLAQLRRGEWEITHGDVGTVQAGQQSLQLLLTHTADRFNRKTAPRKTIDRLVRYEQVAARADLHRPESRFHHVEAAGLHDRRVRLVQVAQLVRQRRVPDAQAARIGGRIVVEPLIVVHAVHVRRTRVCRCDIGRCPGSLAVQHQKQFLAFVAGGDDVHFGHSAREIVDRLAPVEHRRQFDHHISCLSQQQIAQRQHVGRAVLDRVGAGAVLVAAGRVDVDQLRRLHRT